MRTKKTMHESMAKKLSVCMTMIALCLCAADAADAQMAQLFEDYGVGIRDSAMGNTGAASADDFAAAFYNPAALVRAKGFGFHMGYKGVYPHLYMKIGNYHERYFTQYPNTNFFLMGLSWNVVAEELINPKWTERFTFGLALALSDYYKSFSIYYDEDTPYFYRYHDRYLNLLPIYASLSIRITDWLSIGGGLVPAPTDTVTSVTVDSHFELPRYRMWANQGTVTRAYGKLEPVLGILLRIPSGGQTDFFSLGAAWRDEVTCIDGEGHAYNTTNVHFEGSTITLPAVPTDILSLTGFSPMQVAMGVAFHPNDNWTLTVEELWKRWSHWKNFFINSPDPKFNDTWNTRFGGEYKRFPKGEYLQTAAARAGFYREFSPVPDQNGESNYLDPNKWVVTAGFETSWIDPLDIFRVPVHIGAAGQVHYMDKIHLHNRQDPDYPELDAWGEVYSLTATMGIKTK